MDEHIKQAARNYLDTDKRLTPKRLWRLWQLARYLDQFDKQGPSRAHAPTWLGADARQLLYQVRAARASERWTRAVASVSRADWQEATRRPGNPQVL